MTQIFIIGLGISALLAVPVAREKSWCRFLSAAIIAYTGFILSLFFFLIGHELGLFIGVGISILLAAPGSRGESWHRFLSATLLSIAGVLLPLFFFFATGELVPESKSDCAYGWLSCFMAGKVALTPLALFATGALYALEVLRVKERTALWIVSGMFFGATVAVVCFAFGLFWFFPLNDSFIILLLAVPCYVAVWYSIRAWQLIRTSRPDKRWYLVTFGSSVPFWLASWGLSRGIYDSLPDTMPGCFVVTAASRGHEAVVGPLVPVTRRGRKIRVNQQLLVFWQFEAVWQQLFPASHRWFRSLYNRIGPIIARRLTSPWLADAAYLALKPCEWFARVVIGLEECRSWLVRQLSLRLLKFLSTKKPYENHQS